MPSAGNKQRVGVAVNEAELVRTVVTCMAARIGNRPFSMAHLSADESKAYHAALQFATNAIEKTKAAVPAAA